MLYEHSVLYHNYLSLYINNHPQSVATTPTRKYTQTFLPDTLMHQNEIQQGVVVLTGGSGGICNFLSATNYSSNKAQEKWRLLV